MLPEGEELFKIAAKRYLKDVGNSQEKQKVSIEYQVLTDETAFLGVWDQLNTATRDIVTVKVPTLRPYSYYYNENEISTDAAQRLRHFQISGDINIEEAVCFQEVSNGPE